MSVIIFGANGYLGRNLIHELSSQERNVTALSRSFDEDFFSNYPQINTRVIDYRDKQSYADLLKEGDIVIHLIYMGIPFQANLDKKSDILNNLIPSVELAELCAAKSIKRLVYASSGGTVYGDSEEKLINEDHPCDPVNSYGITKLATEKYIRAISREKKMDYAILRISNPYGGFSNPHSPVGLFAKIEQSLTDNTPFELRVPLETTRDYIPIEDVVEAFLSITDHDEPVFDTFNVSSGHGLSIRQVIKMMEEKHGKKLIINKVSSGNPEVRCNILDNSKLKRFLSN